MRDTENVIYLVTDRAEPFAVFKLFLPSSAFVFLFQARAVRFVSVKWGHDAIALRYFHFSLQQW